MFGSDTAIITLVLLVVVGLLILWYLAQLALEYIFGQVVDFVGDGLFGSKSKVGKKASEIENLASGLGMELSSSGFFSHEWTGRRGPHRIGLIFDEKRYFTVMFENPTIPSSLRLTSTEPKTGVMIEDPTVPSSLRLPSTEPRTGAKLKTGDPEFDREVAIDVDEAIGLAIFSEKNRAYVRNLITKGFEIEVEDGCVRLSKNKPGLRFPQVVDFARPALNQAQELAQILGIEGSQVPNRLALNAENDALPEVRRKNMAALAYHYPSHAISRRRLLAALDGSDPDLQFVAAEFLFSLASTAPETVSQAAAVLAAAVGSAAVSEDVKVSAIKTFAARKDLDETSRSLRDSVFESVLAKEQGEIVAAAVETVAALDLRQWIPRLQEMVRSADGPMFLALARACGIFGGPEAQDILLELLQSDEKAIAEEAANALGAAGDVSAVDPLIQLKERLDDDSPLMEAATEAIRRIQGRLVGAEAGQLSLAVTSELQGALSQSTAAAGPGDLALADPPSPAKPRKRRAQASDSSSSR